MGLFYVIFVEERGCRRSEGVGFVNFELEFNDVSATELGATAGTNL